MSENGLRGVRVLVTRPVHQAGSLARLIEQAGGEAIGLPTIEIAPPADPAALDALLARLAEFDMAIFISPNAVRGALARLEARGGLPPELALAAVGQGTLRALQAAGCSTVLAPTVRFDSEALLELLPRERVAGKHIVIFRGEGGRELLGETLTARGARIFYAVCYRRLPPRTPDVAALARLMRGEIDVITVTSAQGLRNLYDLAGETGRARLLGTPIVVVSERQARACRELGFHAALRVAGQASDAAILESLRAWRSG